MLSLLSFIYFSLLKIVVIHISNIDDLNYCYSVSYNNTSMVNKYIIMIKKKTFLIVVKYLSTLK